MFSQRKGAPQGWILEPKCDAALQNVPVLTSVFLGESEMSLVLGADWGPTLILIFGLKRDTPYV